MAVLTFPLQTCRSTNTTNRTVKTVERGQTFVPKALGSDVQNFKSTEQTHHASDLCILASYKVKFSGLGNMASGQ